MTATRFSMQPHLEHLANSVHPHFAFRARTQQEFDQWQTEFRAELARALGLEGREAVQVAARKIAERDCGTYIEEKYALQVGEGVLAPMYLLVPKREPPFKAILAFHGHDPGVQTILGHYADQNTESENRESDNNFAQSFAEAGFLVCAVEQRGIGERVTEQVRNEPYPRSCRHLAFEYMMHGRTLLGERVWDGMCALYYLQTRTDVDRRGLGCTGHSGGGTTALFLAAVDTRIAATVVSGYFCSFRASILAMSHCECNYVPGILELGEMGDLAALVAPRGLGIVHGEQDSIFPIAGTREQFEVVKRAYAVHGNLDGCSLMVHPFGHRYHFASSRTWFENHL